MELLDFKQVYKYAHYTSFAVDDAASNYTLHVDGYNGTAGEENAHTLQFFGIIVTCRKIMLFWTMLSFRQTAVQNFGSLDSTASTGGLKGIMLVSISQFLQKKMSAFVHVLFHDLELQIPSLVVKSLFILFFNTTKK